jgi:hypothetical protein
MEDELTAIDEFSPSNYDARLIRKTDMSNDHDPVVVTQILDLFTTNVKGPRSGDRKGRRAGGFHLTTPQKILRSTLRMTRKEGRADSSLDAL